MLDDVRRPESGSGGPFKGVTTWFVVPSARMLTWARGSVMVLSLTLMGMCIVVGALRLSSPPSLAPTYLVLGLTGGVLILCGWLGLWRPLVVSARRAAQAQPGAEWVAFGQMVLNTSSGGKRIGQGWGIAGPDALEITATRNWFSPRADGTPVVVIPWGEITEIRSFRAARLMAPVLRVRTESDDILDLDLVPRSGFSGRCITPGEVGDAVVLLDARRIPSN
ncbi:hypothetical protein [Microbacterium sp. 13-71-7]|jgi:hypothetical protein|uniref:hypothetical protein n=1 Tax=Microbacterium sp. 13-71-7 TaxID=1970399 RepID=UPI000BDAB6B9|nr:hypothetical protein [Microbacterium sp. 13-71-7]OZB80390.1 MAG: hypothetical protein B7X32_19520 [Microbacterium sp. 13-71-7]